MKFKYKRIHALPPLAWTLIISRNNICAEVLHGDAVAIKPQFFIAGAWEDDFSKGNLTESYAMQGSGAVLNEPGGVTICCSSNCQDGVYLYKNREQLLFSNSISFLLALTGNSLDKDCYRYEEILNSSFYGIKKYDRILPLADGEIIIYRYVNIYVSTDGTIKEYPKPQSPPFTSFEEYNALLQNTIEAIVNNARNIQRPVTYGLVTTISRGYDAVASSVYAHKTGCNKALTFSSPAKYAPDSGVENAKAIGFSEIIEGDGLAYLKENKLWEAEAAAGGDVGGLVSFSVFANHYRNCILFLGLKGDCIWGKDSCDANRYMDFGHMAIAAEQNPEHYLDNNVIALCVPVLMADRWPEIYRLSNSPDMQRWSIGGDYDRPIPRRIAESSGVPRDSFGQKKRGAGFTFRFEPSVKCASRKMSARSFNSLVVFKRQRNCSKYKEFKASLRYYFYSYPYYLAYIAAKLKIKYRHNDVKFVSSPISSLMIQWGMDKMTTRYKEALKL